MERVVSDDVGVGGRGDRRSMYPGRGEIPGDLGVALDPAVVGGDAIHCHVQIGGCRQVNGRIGAREAELEVRSHIVAHHAG